MTPQSNAERNTNVRVQPDESKTKGDAWHDLVLASHLLETALERQSQRDGGVSHGHFKLLVLLSSAENQTLRLKGLADSLRFSQSRISHALTALESQELVTRRHTTEGRRASEASLTPKGRLLVGRVLRAQRREIRDPLLDGLGNTGTAALGEVSSRIIMLLDEERSSDGDNT